jgi:regulator of nucleoside diphosphate kinase
MSPVVAPERTLTLIDHVRLTRLIARQPQAAAAEALDELLSVGELVASESVPPDVVTMYSRIAVVHEPDGTRMTISPCYPEDADPAEGFISALAPLGTALLGLRVGDVAHWSGPGGEPHATRIVEMLFQPEESGDFTT